MWFSHKPVGFTGPGGEKDTPEEVESQPEARIFEQGTFTTEKESSGKEFEGEAGVGGHLTDAFGGEYTDVAHGAGCFSDLILTDLSHGVWDNWEASDDD